MGWKAHAGGKAGGGLGGYRLRLTPSSAAARSRVKLWAVRATTTVLLWTCVVQLTAVGDTWGPRVLKGWPSCLSAPDEAAVALPATARPEPVVEKAALPPKSEYSLGCLRLLARVRLACSGIGAVLRPRQRGSRLDSDRPPASW